MPHSRFFTHADLKEDHIIAIEDEEFHHLVKVMRVREGEEVELVNGRGFLANGLVNTIERHKALCLVKEVTFEPPSASGFIIAQALLKPASIELIVEKNTELGVKEIWLFPAEYSEKDSLSDNQLQRLHRHIISAVKQCGRLYLPTLRLFSSLDDVLSECSDLQKFFGDVDINATDLISLHIKTPIKNPICFIGPEKGFHKKEVDLLVKNSFLGVSLNKNILRAETASITASALFSFL